MSPDFGEQPLDGADGALLDHLAAIYGRLDPPPSDLDDRVRFAIALRNVEIEVARLATEQQPVGAARATERTRTTTFDAPSRTIMITVVDRPDGLVRLDGWLAPAATLRVELRFPEPVPPQVVTADETGRFVFDAVPHGLVQMLVDPGEGAEGPRVVTPSFVL
ncbi:hypothetical protein [Micromonospora vulcania]|uniref:Carboxypeptidase regulatory-like domain-containing protein n=1 Tax=Micromonospora vulcania TaxID=1441873 RepID=A0ABW1H6B6_9ACTN